MKKNILLFVVETALLLTIVYANECTDQCDVKYAGIGSKIRFCGSDLLSHETSHESIHKHCYFDCGVGAYYQGSCGCANDCFEDFHRGTCVRGGANVAAHCECVAGWGGADCSLPAATHDCSLHGKLVVSSSSPTGFFCDCDDGFTGPDCSTAAFALRNAPWGDLFPDGAEFHNDQDRYGDEHPLFDLSALPSLHITVSEEDYLSQVDPVNCYNATYVPAALYYDSNAGSSSARIQQSFDKIGLRIKGAWSRMDLKKGFSLKLDKYVKNTQFFGLSKLSLKPGADDDDTFLKNVLYTNLQRAAEVPVQRASYVLLYLDGRYNGLYVMHEDVDEVFVQSRVESDRGTGNLFKLCHDVNLRYYGDDVATYQNTLAHYPSGDAYNAYELAASQTDDWTDLVELLSFVNKSSDAQFEREVASRVDIPTVLKGLVVESFLLGGDGFIKGQNYYLYHRDGAPSAPNQWTLFNNDFDQEFYFDAIGEPQDDPNIFSYVRRPVTSGDYNPLLDRLFAIKTYKDLYAQYYRAFLEQTCGSQSKQRVVQRFTALYDLALPWVAQDKLWQISQGVDAQHFVLCAQNTTFNLEYRYKDTWKQVQDYLDAN